MYELPFKKLDNYTFALFLKSSQCVTCDDDNRNEEEHKQIKEIEKQPNVHKFYAAESVNVLFYDEAIEGETRNRNRIPKEIQKVADRR